MAYQMTFAQGEPAALKSAVSGVASFFVSVGRFMVSASANSGRLRQVEMLQAKSDRELADMGLKRDAIVHHVFRDVYYI
ncbi:MAG TPA: DUF1127 domain-containing protein [Roseobacter sp.]|nr:DUF1127 domain-containing protein [Roseobacter sp.]HEC70723.1 DUF1127 domain-containing protein [Roseobacter sp.]